MELKITKDHENVMLKRREVSATLSFDKATPSNAEVAKAIATKLSAHEDVIVMKQILGGFGSNTAQVTAYIYATKEQREKIEPKIKVKKAEGATAPAAK